MTEPKASRSTSSGAVAAVAAIAVAAGVIGALALDCRPTGYDVLDAVLRAAFATGVTVTTSSARRWTWIVLAGIAAAASRQVVPLAASWSALALAFGAVLTDHRRRWLGALVGLGASTALLHLGAVGPHGLPSVLALLAAAPPAASAYRRLHRGNRRRVRRALVGVAACVLAAAAGFAIAALSAASRVDTGLAEAREGLVAAKAGDDRATTEHLDRATAAFVEARASFDAWYAIPARVLPGTAYQVHAVHDMAAVGRDLSTSASSAARSADYRSIPMEDGRVDIDRITALERPLVDIEAALGSARTTIDRVQTEWLVPPLRDRHATLDTALGEAVDETGTALEAVRAAPDILGQNGLRRYFIAFTTPAEARGLGGFMGNWAELTADHGKLELTRTGRSADLAPRPRDPPRVLDAPPDYLERYGAMHPEIEVRDVTFSPDFPSVAKAIESIYPQTDGGAPLDGVLALDPYALGSMLELTGPVRVTGLDFSLDASNAADFLLREQYAEFGANATRADFLDEAARETFDALIRARRLRPLKLAQALGPRVEEGRLRAFSSHEEAQRLIQRIGLDGAFPARGGEDFFALVTQNAGNNKIDVFLRRSIHYDVTFVPDTGAIDATVTIELHNDAPSGGLPPVVIDNRPDSGQPPGTNWMWFNFYTPHQLERATLDGKPLPTGAKSELGVEVYDAFLPVPSQGTATIVLTLRGSIDPSRVYRVGIAEQPLVNRDRVVVALHPGDAVTSVEPRTNTTVALTPG